MLSMREQLRPALTPDRREELQGRLERYLTLVNEAVRWMRATASKEQNKRKADSAREIADIGETLLRTVTGRIDLQEAEVVVFLHAAQKFLGEKTLDADVLETPHSAPRVIADKE